MFTLLVTLALSNYGKGVLKTASTLFGLIAGYLHQPGSDRSACIHYSQSGSAARCAARTSQGRKEVRRSTYVYTDL